MSQGSCPVAVAASDRPRVSVITPGVTESELAESISDPTARAAMETYRAVAMPADAIAAAVSFAIEQPAQVDVNEVVVRPVSVPR
ncbi:hypothetical protein [Nocardia sp.]|uniref:hypothetical protein n=1 Tax=Nocardia sp. TaxID=1821 RepID=UPI00345517FF